MWVHFLRVCPEVDIPDMRPSQPFLRSVATAGQRDLRYHE